MDIGDLLELALNILCLLFDCGFEWYRFYGCVLLSFAVISLICWKIPSQTLTTALSVPIAVGGIGWGIAWEWRSRH